MKKRYLSILIAVLVIIAGLGICYAKDAESDQGNENESSIVAD